MLMVSLNTSKIIAASPFNITNSGDTATLNDTPATSGADALVKGDVNLWDSEW